MLVASGFWAMHVLATVLLLLDGHNAQRGELSVDTLNGKA